MITSPSLTKIQTLEYLIPDYRDPLTNDMDESGKECLLRLTKIIWHWMMHHFWAVLLPSLLMTVYYITTWRPRSPSTRRDTKRAFILVVSMLHVFPTTLAANRHILAHDCRNPTGITAVASGRSEPDPCVEEPDASIAERDVSYLLLSEEGMEKMEGYRCSVLDNRRVSYCGNYDHQTLYAKYNYEDLPIPVSISSCRQMVERGEYVDPKGHKHDVSVDSATNVHYQSVGRTFSSNEGSEIECEGGRFDVDGQSYAEMIVDHNMIVRVERTEIRYSEGEVADIKDGRRMPCSIDAMACETADATFLWDKRAHRCELAVAKMVTGLVAQIGRAHV